MNAEALYTRLADSYDVTLTLAGYQMAVDYFIKRMPFERTAPLKILDAGCGTGFYSLALLNYFSNSTVVAFDLNRKMIEKLSHKIVKRELDPRIQVFRGNMVHALPIEKNQFDLVVTAGVLEYVSIDDAVPNLKEYLHEKGFWFNSPIKTNWFGQLVGKLYKLRPYSRHKNLEVFEKNGFSLMKEVDFLGLKEAHVFQRLA